MHEPKTQRAGATIAISASTAAHTYAPDFVTWTRASAALGSYALRSAPSATITKPAPTAIPKGLCSPSM